MVAEESPSTPAPNVPSSHTLQHEPQDPPKYRLAPLYGLLILGQIYQQLHPEPCRQRLLFPPHGGHQMQQKKTSLTSFKRITTHDLLVGATFCKKQLYLELNKTLVFHSPILLLQ
nr:hypothetical protein Iba_scaffold15087CG0010 [Ipomoea batatas]